MDRRQFDPTPRAREMDGVDFGKTASDYAKYRAGFPDSFFTKLEQHGVRYPGRPRRGPWYRYGHRGAGTRAPRRGQGGRDSTPLKQSRRRPRNLDKAAGVQRGVRKRNGRDHRAAVQVLRLW